jgi:transposase-like protein
VNHNLQNVFFGGAFLLNERIESYEWLFQTFLNAIGGKSLRLNITDGHAIIRPTIKTGFPDTYHIFCMWHIIEKVGDKAGPPTRNDPIFGVD